jgi:hypothetical protein
MSTKASFILAMDENTQKNHLKFYGITFFILGKNYKTNWFTQLSRILRLPDAIEIHKEYQDYKGEL